MNTAPNLRDRSCAWLYTIIALTLLAGYSGAYVCLVKQERAGIGLGSFAWPRYCNDQRVNDWAEVFFSPVHNMDRAIRRDYWAYKTWEQK
ncbi:MAG: hypothetical protein JWN70_5534 [Planctomycetaceae bacterium]|nr:hypothetical protein [Planctomycetaceae bacterium]